MYWPAVNLTVGGSFQFKPEPPHVIGQFFNLRTDRPVFTDIEQFLGNFDRHIVADLDLAGQPDIVSLLLFGQKWRFRGQHRSAAVHAP